MPCNRFFEAHELLFSASGQMWQRSMCVLRQMPPRVPDECQHDRLLTKKRKRNRVYSLYGVPETLPQRRVVTVNEYRYLTFCPRSLKSGGDRFTTCLDGHISAVFCSKKYRRDNTFFPWQRPYSLLIYIRKQSRTFPFSPDRKGGAGQYLKQRLTLSWCVLSSADGIMSALVIFV